MTSLALVFPYSDVAKSHVCQKETKGCQKERMGGNKQTLLSLVLRCGRGTLLHTIHAEENTPDCELHRSEPEPNCCELHVSRFGAVEIRLRSHVAFTKGHRRWKIFFCCLHSFIAENQKSYIFFMFLLIQSHPSM